MTCSAFKGDVQELSVGTGAVAVHSFLKSGRYDDALPLNIY